MGEECPVATITPMAVDGSCSTRRQQRRSIRIDTPQHLVEVLFDRTLAAAGAAGQGVGIENCQGASVGADQPPCLQQLNYPADIAAPHTEQCRQLLLGQDKSLAAG